MKKLLEIALGVLIAIGGFVDIGDLVRERLGAGVGLLSLAASFLITLLTWPPRSAGWRSRYSWPPASTTCCSSR